MMFFQIVNEKGEKSTGGHHPRFTDKKGKIWHSIGHVRSHLSAVIEMDQRYKANGGKGRNIYANCKIVQYEYVETDSIACEVELHEAEMRARAKHPHRFEKK